ncbi:MAG: V-type ATP synthase subunit B [Oscillospiraceae bacterium]|jgi:V/A-type H+-transporting ATPase subunit B|nr:V-type ATP synthase subunit B [Oscillospiraceae bacterium]
MIIRYSGVKEIKGSIIAIEGVKDAFYDEMVDVYLENGQARSGRIAQIDGDRAIIQVFEGTKFISLANTEISLTGSPMKIALSPEILGRIFSGTGKPIDGLSEVYSKFEEFLGSNSNNFFTKYKNCCFRDVNGLPINPVSRIYPRNYICTGISSIDILVTLVCGQKLPIFSGSGMKHNKLAAQIVKQAKNADDNNFAIVFAAMGVKNDVATYFRKEFENSGVLERVVMFLNLSSDPVVERILTPRSALTAAEYLAFDLGYHVLVIMTDMSAYAEALREFSSSKGEIPGRKGFPGYLYSDFASLYERAGMIKDKKGSVTQIPILTMPGDDITHPIPDLTGYITEGQIVLSRTLESKGLYPAVSVLPSISRLMKDGIGEGYTREDHVMLADQLFASYAKVMDIRSLASVIGEDDLSETDKIYLKFGITFEENFINQGFHENRSIKDSLDLGWRVISLLPKKELSRVKTEILDKYYVIDSKVKVENNVIQTH